MAAIIVEGIPEGLLARLRLAAEGNGRSLSREVVVQLARSVSCSRQAPAGETTASASRCVVHAGCHCAARWVKARAVGWGGPAR